MGVSRQTRVLHSGDNERVDRCLRGFGIGRVRPARVFVPNPPGDPESADGRLAGLSRSRLLALGGLDALARGGLQDLLIE
jgi:hypothetical protein